ncbi:MAG: Bax inhibitor-1/YccA family protein [Acholeplasmatales bacterium]|nr:Bax inhibitor-1/YccA family protein [Acholeplasmatales bacterium]
MKPTPIFSNIQTGTSTYDDTNKATYKGITVKTLIFFALTIAAALAGALYLNSLFKELDDTNLVIFIGLIIGAAILSLVSAIVGRISYRLAMVFGTIYSISMGFLLGTITALVEKSVPGIGIAAVFGTLIIFAVMLLLFFTGIVKSGRVLRAVLIGILLGVLSLSLFTVVLVLTNVITSTEYLWLLLLIDGLYLIYAVIMLCFNFLEAEAVVKGGATKQAEWSVALGLMTTLAYIYIELLRILLIIASIVGNKN